MKFSVIDLISDLTWRRASVNQVRDIVKTELGFVNQTKEHRYVVDGSKGRLEWQADV